MNKVDIATKTRSVKKFTYDELNDNKLNGQESVNEIMKLGKKFLKEFKEYKQHYVSENSLALGKNKNTYHDAVGEKQLLKSNAHKNNLNTTELTIKLPGDFNFAPGKIIELEILRQADISEELEEGRDYIDEELSGKYLVSSCVHQFTKDGYFIQTKIKKDSFIVKQVPSYR